MEEKELERLARRLGDGAAARLDVERTAERVLARLRERSPEDDKVVALPSGRAPAVGFRMPGWLKVAALVVLLVGGGLIGRAAWKGGGSEGVTAVPYELAELEVSELEEVLDSLSWETPAHQSVSYAMEDLSNEELQELLEEMES